MSREHLYKAKRVNWRELPKEEWWVEGNLLISDDDYYIIPDFGVSCVGKLNNYVCDNLITLHAFEVDKETVCEYTGLTDKNGNRIFEGDIMKIPSFEPDTMVIGFIEGTFCLANSKQEYVADIHYIHHAGVNQTEIIGNIFDNIELLEGDVTE